MRQPSQYLMYIMGLATACYGISLIRRVLNLIDKTQIKWKVPKTHKPLQFKSAQFKTAQVKPISAIKIPEVVPEHLWFDVSAFVCGMASIKGLYPFGLSFTAAAAIHRKRHVPAAAFALAGAVIMLRNLQALRYLAAYAIFLVVFKLLPPAVKHRDYPVSVLAFFSNALAGGLFLIGKGTAPYDLIFLLMESTLSAIAIFILPGGLPWIYRAGTKNAEKSIGFAVMAGVLMPAAAGIWIMGINIREVLSVFGVMIMALIEGPGAGASTGLIFGLIGFSPSVSPWVMALLAFCGLLAGSFYKLGKPGVFAGFSIGYLLFNLYVNSMGELLIPLPALLISSALLFAVPNKWRQSMELRFGSSKDAAWGSREMINFGGARLYELAGALEELGRAYDDKAALSVDTGEANQGENIDKIYREIKAGICSACHLKKICWELEPRKTIRAFYELIKNFDAGTSGGKLPELFKTRCANVRDIQSLVAKEAHTLNLRRKAKEITESHRSLIKDRYNIAAKVMKELAVNFPGQRADEIRIRLKGKLSELGVRVEELYCTQEDRFIAISLVKGPCVGEKQCENIIPQAISQVLGEGIELNIVDCPNKSGCPKCRISGKTKGFLRVVPGVTGIAKEGGAPSGDSFSFMEIGSGQYLLALSDGMGVGERAANHSEKTLSIVEKLFETGFESDAAIKIVNSTMMAAAQEEGFSTLDLAVIDTYSGHTRFIKSGAPPSFIRRGSKILRVKGGSLPVGILDGVYPKITELRLTAGDTVIMVTDGVIDGLATSELGGEEALHKLVGALGGKTPREAAEEILKASRINGVKDDMTVMVANIHEEPKILC